MNSSRKMTIALNEKTTTFAITWDKARYRELEECLAKHNAEATGIARYRKTRCLECIE
jgi:hypothetical protein